MRGSERIWQIATGCVHVSTSAVWHWLGVGENHSRLCGPCGGSTSKTFLRAYRLLRYSSCSRRALPVSVSPVIPFKWDPWWGGRHLRDGGVIFSAPAAAMATAAGDRRASPSPSPSPSLRASATQVGDMTRGGFWSDMGGRGASVTQACFLLGLDSRLWSQPDLPLPGLISMNCGLGRFRGMGHVAGNRGFVEGTEKRRDAGKRSGAPQQAGGEGGGRQGSKRREVAEREGGGGTGPNSSRRRKGRRCAVNPENGTAAPPAVRGSVAEKGGFVERTEKKEGGGKECAGGEGGGRKGNERVGSAEREGGGGTGVKSSSRKRRKGTRRAVSHETGTAAPAGVRGSVADGRCDGSDGDGRGGRSDGHAGPGSGEEVEEQEEQEEEDLSDASESTELLDDVSSERFDDASAPDTSSSSSNATPTPNLSGTSSPSLHHQFQQLYSSHLAPISPPFASYRATRDNAMALLALHPSPAALTAIFRACSSLFLVPQPRRIRAALEIFWAHGLPEPLFLRVIQRVPELILDARLDEVSSNGSSDRGGDSSSSDSSSSSSSSSDSSETSSTLDQPLCSHQPPLDPKHQPQRHSLTPLSNTHNHSPCFPPSHFPPSHLPHVQQVLHFLFLHLPPPTVTKLIHSASCRVFRTPLPTLLLHLCGICSLLCPPHSLLFRYPLALRFSPEILAQKLSRLAEIVQLTEGEEGGGGERGMGGGEGEGKRKEREKLREMKWNSSPLLPIPPLSSPPPLTASPAFLSLVHKQPHILHANRVTMQEVVTTLTTLFGKPGTSYVLSRHPALLTASPRTVEEAMFALIDIFGEEVTVDMIQRDPGIIQVRQGTIRAKIDFILEEMKRTKEDIRVWPTVLLRSLPRVLVPRYFLVTRKDPQAAKVLSLPCLFSSSPARFKRRWEVSEEDWKKALMVGEVWEARRKEESKGANASR
ncbi:hypothetical protein CLOM_g21943 [Closterium sp. NIES-68]|nr:hypothetical protein CLOM_g21943 [Closterium sp. NIES-68]